MSTLKKSSYSSIETSIAIAIVVCLVGLVWYLGAFKVFDNAKADLQKDQEDRTQLEENVEDVDDDATVSAALLSVGSSVRYTGFANGAGYDGIIESRQGDFYTIQVTEVRTASPKQYYLPATVCSGNVSLGNQKAPNSGVGSTIKVPTSCF